MNWLYYISKYLLLSNKNHIPSCIYCSTDACRPNKNLNFKTFVPEFNFDLYALIKLMPRDKLLPWLARYNVAINLNLNRILSVGVFSWFELRYPVICGLHLGTKTMSKNFNLILRIRHCCFLWGYSCFLWPLWLELLLLWDGTNRFNWRHVVYLLICSVL